MPLGPAVPGKRPVPRPSRGSAAMPLQISRCPTEVDSESTDVQSLACQRAVAAGTAAVDLRGPQLNSPKIHVWRRTAIFFFGTGSTTRRRRSSPGGTGPDAPAGLPPTTGKYWLLLPPTAISPATSRDATAGIARASCWTSIKEIRDGCHFCGYSASEMRCSRWCAQRHDL